ncbi:MAG: nucleotide exchange factor GrpE [Cryobacterium sp.]|nr:nucleotide exchange factor GrpE [Cryobacterium sp.]MBX3089636.1 nucleotide exchange factor GrpE [Cryobacterium sp.]MBX3115872.1 nucleotide exchange factor GrpE [Cryobacterium sp.]
MATAKDKSKGHEEEHEEPVVRDKRRIDPETGEARKPAKAGSKSESETELGGETLTDEDVQKLLDSSEDPKADSSDSEHLDDLKRIQAEYANYRKRVERDRMLAHELAIAEVFLGFLPVLDDLDLADAHGDLVGGPLDLVAQKIRVFAERYGLEKVGEIGDQFDPRIHEAIAQVPAESAEANDRIVEVVQYGYRIGERLLRPAKVAVSTSGD